jgi:hypothetical protein
MKKMFNEGNQIHNLISSSGSGTVINYGSGSDFLTSYGSGYGSGSTSQKVTVPTVPVPQHCLKNSNIPNPNQNRALWRIFSSNRSGCLIIFHKMLGMTGTE